MSPIEFGSEGWEAEMGVPFTFNNVRLFAMSYSDYLKSRYKKNIRIVVNFDTRMLSARFANEAAKILSLQKIRSLIPMRDTPIPAVSCYVMKNELNGSLNFTGGIKNPLFNGIKILDDKGSLESPSEMRKLAGFIEKRKAASGFKPQYADNEYIETVRLRSSYFRCIEKMIDFDLIRRSGIKIIVDSLYGSSRDYLDFILSRNGIETISIHNFPYSSFGDIIPDCGEKSLSELSVIVKENHADIGIATDINGTRFGIVNGSGEYVDPSAVIPPLTEYLIKEKKIKGGIIKSKVGDGILTSLLICEMAAHNISKGTGCIFGDFHTGFNEPIGYGREMNEKRKI